MDKKKKTIFEHAADVFGVDEKEKKTFSMEKIKALAISCIVYVILGFAIGMILDIFLETAHFSIVFALLLFILWLLKAFGKYLRI